MRESVRVAKCVSLVAHLQARLALAQNKKSEKRRLLSPFTQRDAAKERKKGPPARFRNLPTIGHEARQGENEANVSFHLDARRSNIEKSTLKEAMKLVPNNARMRKSLFRSAVIRFF